MERSMVGEVGEGWVVDEASRVMQKWTRRGVGDGALGTEGVIGRREVGEGSRDGLVMDVARLEPGMRRRTGELAHVGV